MDDDGAWSQAFPSLNYSDVLVYPYYPYWDILGENLNYNLLAMASNLLAILTGTYWSAALSFRPGGLL